MLGNSICCNLGVFQWLLSPQFRIWRNKPNHWRSAVSGPRWPPAATPPHTICPVIDLKPTRPNTQTICVSSCSVLDFDLKKNIFSSWDDDTVPEKVTFIPPGYCAISHWLFFIFIDQVKYGLGTWTLVDTGWRTVVSSDFGRSAVDRQLSSVVLIIPNAIMVQIRFIK